MRTRTTSPSSCEGGPLLFGPHAMRWPPVRAAPAFPRARWTVLVASLPVKYETCPHTKLVHAAHSSASFSICANKLVVERELGEISLYAEPTSTKPKTFGVTRCQKFFVSSARNLCGTNYFECRFLRKYFDLCMWVWCRERSRLDLAVYPTSSYKTQYFRSFMHVKKCVVNFRTLGTYAAKNFATI